MVSAWGIRKREKFISAVLVCGLILLLAGCGGGGGGGGGTVDVTAPLVSVLGFEAPTHPSGGEIIITVDARDENGVSSVEATITYPSSWVTKVKMIPVGGHVWMCTYSVPANGTTNPQTYRVVVTATDSGGNTASAPAFTIPVPGVMPPPNAPI